MTNKVLCVDLDGTFIKTDMLYESFFYCFFLNPFIIFSCIFWLMCGGKTLLKANLAKRFSFLAENIPINDSVKALLLRKKAEGYKIYLVSASYISVVERFFSNYSDIFDGFYGTELNSSNLSGQNKAAFLNKNFGFGQYEYVGNSKDDLDVWNNSSKAYCLTDNKSLISKINVPYELLADNCNNSSMALVLKQLRCHQWSKNALFAVPVFASAQILPLIDYFNLFIGIIAFSLIASSVYIINDIIDLDNDRAHETKRRRPLASGNLSLLNGCLLLLAILSFGIILAASISLEFLILTGGYLLINLLYSVKLKSVLIFDTLLLSLLYTYRIFLGCIITNLDVSIWLISLSFFLFLALAFIKRYIELNKLQLTNKVQAKGRAYSISDMTIVQIMSVASGFTATLIFDLYLNDDSIRTNFKNIWLAYCCLPVLLYWLCHIFMNASRGQISDDPVSYALKNRLSVFLGFIFCCLFWASVYF
ncbi:MAG: UbiA family prenyltransferase [Succinivibrio sp.]